MVGLSGPHCPLLLYAPPPQRPLPNPQTHLGHNPHHCMNDKTKRDHRVDLPSPRTSCFVRESNTDTWKYNRVYLGMQFGDDFSTSQVANSFMGVGPRSAMFKISNCSRRCVSGRPFTIWFLLWTSQVENISFKSKPKPLHNPCRPSPRNAVAHAPRPRPHLPNHNRTTWPCLQWFWHPECNSLCLSIHCVLVSSSLQSKFVVVAVHLNFALKGMIFWRTMNKAMPGIKSCTPYLQGTFYLQLEICYTRCKLNALVFRSIYSSTANNSQQQTNSDVR